MPCRNNVEAESRELRARFEAAETRLTDKDDMIADLRQQRDLAQASPATAQGRITALLTDQRVVIRPCAGDGGYGGGADNSHFTESLLRISTGSQSVKPESAQSIVRPIPEFATGPNFRITEASYSLLRETLKNSAALILDRGKSVTW